LNFTQRFANKYETTFWKIEQQFALQDDPLFRYYLYCTAIICVAIIAIKSFVPNMALTFSLFFTYFVTIATIFGSLIYTGWGHIKVKYLVKILIWIKISICLFLCSIIDVIAVSFFF
jgi:hypothetical protein